ncbi:MAG: HAMP domain-containing histidine kinase [Thermoflexales bacterium]|nr:HAMP domain-containing histidine kinase [Thermoflexales bacterium]
MKQFPLRWRIPALYALILLLTLSGASALLYAQQERFLIDDLAARLIERVSPLMDRRLIDAPTRGPGGRDPNRTRDDLITLVSDLTDRDLGAMVYGLDGSPIVTTTRGLALPIPDADQLARAGRGANAPIVTRGAGGNALWMLLPARSNPGEAAAILQVGTDLSATDGALRTLALALAVSVAVVVIATTALGVTVTRRALGPLDRVVNASARIAGGDLSQRVGLSGSDELGRLGASFDGMVTRLESAFAAQKRFVADAAHELRTPLTVMSGSIDLLRMGVAEGDPQTTTRLLNNLDVELDRVTRLSNDLLTLSVLDAQPRLSLQPLDLSALLRNVAERYTPALSAHAFDLRVADGLRARGDEDRLRQVFVNLLDNARKHTPAGGRITLGAAAEAGNVRVWVEDTGAGIPEEALPHLFDRFYRVDDARARAAGGSGLGLAICRAITDAHAGQIGVSSTPGKGSTFWVTLPRHEP